ncbi:MAG TPA: glycosyltransferase [Stenomitos sp.]
MKFTLQAFGSAGDIRPLIALGGGLRAAGHDVLVLTTPIDNQDYAPLCLGLGVAHRQVPSSMTLSQATIQDIARLKNGLTMLKRTFEETFLPFVDEMYRVALEACRESDALVSHFSLYSAKAAAIQAGKPHISVTYWPGSLPSLHLPIEHPLWGPLFNPLIGKVLEVAFDSFLKRDMTALWERAGLKPPAHVYPHALFSDELNLIPASPLLWQAPPDWSPAHQLCGFFEMPDAAEAWEMPPTLRDFLAEGEAPIYFTFGSMQHIYPEAMRDLFLETARLLGARAIVQTNRVPTGTRVGEVYFLDKVPHQRIFEHCRLIVHHGGAGTTQAAIRAGRPSVIVAFNEEQVFWGKKLAQQGLSPSPLRYQKTTAPQLAGAVRQASESMRSKAEALGHAMREEKGIATAVQLIETHLTHHVARTSSPTHQEAP